MTDIFLSYAREDIKKAELLATALETKGWTVFWDRTSLLAGQDFEAVIEQAIKQAVCMVVAWSEASKRSDWVRGEASIGRERNILVPILFEPVESPIAFRTLHTENLVGWEGDTGAAEFLKLCKAINECIKLRIALSANLPMSNKLSTKEENSAKTRSIKRLIKNAWDWLSITKHQQTLAFIGGGLMIAITGALQGYQHFFEQPKESRPQIVVSGNENVTAAGDVTINKNGISGAELLKIVKMLIEKSQLDLQEKDHRQHQANLIIAVSDLKEGKNIVGTDEQKKAAYTALAKGDTAQAKTLFAKAAQKGEREPNKIDKHTAEAYRNLGALAYLDNTQEALQAYRRATELDPDNVGGWNNLGHLLTRVGDLDVASIAYSKAQALGEANHGKETKFAAKQNSNRKVPGYLDQNWSHETRMEWWYTSLGSRLLPYDWFLALERPDSEELVSSKANLEQYRFVAWPADSKWNPDGLPIGFAADKDAVSGTRYLGFTCAACHTGKVAYKGNEYIVEGAPAHHDFDRFITEIANSMQKTTDNDDKFSRFAGRVLGANAKPEDVAVLKEQLSQESSKQGQRVTMNQPPHAYGYARLDAFGSIFNEVAVFAINEPSNAQPADAPVSYPILWDTPQHDLVQWNGAAVNAGIGPYSRNAGEVVGVFGDLRIEQTGGVGSSELSFKNHINLKNLGRLEDILTTLWSPLWPEQMLPVIDQTKAQRGKQVFEKNCADCHHDIKRDDPTRKIKATMIPIAEIGTDPAMAMNIITRTSKAGVLEGQPVIPLSKLVPNLDKLDSRPLTVQVVRYGVVGILRDGLNPVTLKEGLPAFREAGIKNSLKDNCDPKQEGLKKCLRPPSYKARPLNGIWASAPFLHNGSVPNLWELLQKPDQRVTTFNVGSWEMDPVKVGFATDAEPATSKFNTMLPGNSNKGHKYGSELSDKEKWELIEYLKTL